MNKTQLINDTLQKIECSAWFYKLNSLDQAGLRQIVSESIRDTWDLAKEETQ